MGNIMLFKVIIYNYLYLVFFFLYRKLFFDYLWYLDDLGVLIYEYF